MRTNIENITPFCATHPGSIIKDELEYRGLKNSELADSIDVQRSVISDIINGKRNVTPEIALKLEVFLGQTAEYWMNLQSNYELDMQRIKQRSQESRTDALSVANYFVEKAMKEGKDITLLTLVKLVYIANGYSLALIGRPITNSRFDKIEAWKFGPVIPSVYNSFKHFKNNPITNKTSVIKWDKDTNDYYFEDPEVEDSDTKTILDRVWVDYKDCTVTQLINELHKDDTPWAKHYKEGMNNAIPDRETMAYYKRLLNL